MCGPTAAQSSISDQQQAFYSQMQEQDKTTFAEDQGILKQMQSVYAPILAAGPHQFGFSDGETTTLNTQATEGVGRNFAHAGTALKEQQASSGGDSYLPTGVQGAQMQGLDADAADQQSGEQQQIQQAGYAQGYNQFTQATGALENTAGLLNPNGTASVTTGAGSAAADTANTIAAQSTSWVAPLLGAVGGVAGAAAGGYTAHH